jgi:hypothetical protein
MGASQTASAGRRYTAATSSQVHLRLWGTSFPNGPIWALGSAHWRCSVDVATARLQHAEPDYKVGNIVPTVAIAIQLSRSRSAITILDTRDTGNDDAGSVKASRILREEGSPKSCLTRSHIPVLPQSAVLKMLENPDAVPPEHRTQAWIGSAR